MTGMEIGTLVRYGVNAVVIVLNNGGYRSLEALGASRSLCEMHPWDYVRVAEALGATGARARSVEEFKAALHAACARSGVSLIEVVLDPKDMSKTLRMLQATVTSSRATKQ
jgi:thiamine pyrophosphate-dependent acetolactate synthase large subunit-like protein